MEFQIFSFSQVKAILPIYTFLLPHCKDFISINSHLKISQPFKLLFEAEKEGSEYSNPYTAVNDFLSRLHQFKRSHYLDTASKLH